MIFFESLLKQAPFFEASESAVKIGWTMKLNRKEQFTLFKFIKHSVYGVYGAVDFKTKQELTFVIL
jgi:hypothetical protein